MEKPHIHSKSLRQRVIAHFFLGLLFMAIIAIAIGRVSRDCWAIQLGWLNQTFGLVLIAGGLALVIWSVCIQYADGKGTPAPKVATQRLVKHGPYAYSRNPMTLGALVMYLGIGFWLGSGIVIILTVLVFSGLLTYIYFHETQELSERFGEEYLEYKKRTPFLLPCFRQPS